ncbi:hypothetical protein [Sporichthya sp.]|uniref:hypothetical protein n=1 Tax=Sporichthya sp. TaxID=65475 RepID=UPI0017E1126E|nr:hypothetical protein [Sporichthya sp.]MBA3744711.1 hypothetical protein [Sporichthya sp.]
MSRRTRVLSAALLAAVVLSGCNDSSDDASPDAAARSEPVLAETAVPQTAGPLTGAQMPAPAILGEGWSERADPGAGHEDETDPDAPSTQARDVAELMDGLVPIGCPEAAVNIALPRPQYALERTYAGPSGQPGVALVLEFADAASPDGFLGALDRQIRACPAAGADPRGPVALGFRGVTRTPEQVSALRQEQGVDADPNQYLVIAVRDGKRVALVFLADTRIAKAPAIGADLIKAIRQT